jgi:hypothetical protein
MAGRGGGNSFFSLSVIGKFPKDDTFQDLIPLHGRGRHDDMRMIHSRAMISVVAQRGFPPDTPKYVPFQEALHERFPHFIMKQMRLSSYGSTSRTLRASLV